MIFIIYRYLYRLYFTISSTSIEQNKKRKGLQKINVNLSGKLWMKSIHKTRRKFHTRFVRFHQKRGKISHSVGSFRAILWNYT